MERRHCACASNPAENVDWNSRIQEYIQKDPDNLEKWSETSRMRSSECRVTQQTRKKTNVLHKWGSRAGSNSQADCESEVWTV